ncbi:unnamed protein product, partial [Ectocarpus sp. 12 AP-2014]
GGVVGRGILQPVDVVHLHEDAVFAEQGNLQPDPRLLGDIDPAGPTAGPAGRVGRRGPRRGDRGYLHRGARRHLGILVRLGADGGNAAGGPAQAVLRRQLPGRVSVHHRRSGRGADAVCDADDAR